MNFKSYYNYDVYEDGRIFSHYNNRFLKQSINKEGYLNVGLWINNVRVSIYIHRLLGEVFLPNFTNLPTVEHKDQNKLNNSLFNLKWENRSNQNHNKSIQINNTSGVKGVFYNKKNGKWCGCMMINKKRLSREFDTKKKAILYRKELEMLSGLPYF